MQNDIWKRIILKEPTPIFLASNGDETGDTKKKQLELEATTDKELKDDQTRQLKQLLERSHDRS